ncbi:PilZ domain-containing protein [Erythrobacter sp. JK5]|uniref:PilZ domain-containing protein n=1 Tax=Erythrobacter sp. JK5 TaxID=2829500 RepID=UPI001BAA0430|nr:PilZ domain-containing protein [Erythrobacter sp. JK5]QUL38238.1 PilZ domain-containing protein [Erythrobacter sp. JK5]
MSSLALRQQAAEIERRRSGRMLVDIPVGLRTVSGMRECEMTNISDAGAKLELEDPPPEGVSGWLVLGEDEIYCTVVWSSEGTCGVAFEFVLQPGMIAQIAGERAKEIGPAANTSNIRLGRKRSALVSRCGAREKSEF